MAKMSDSKKGFYLYCDYIEHVGIMSDEDAGKLLKAILAYENGIDVGELTGMPAMAFSFIRAQLDRDNEKYDIICRRNRENGSKGGRPKRPQETSVSDKTQVEPASQKNVPENRPVSTVSTENPAIPKKPDTDTETDTDTKDKEKNTKKEKTARIPEFEQFWHVYPRKDDKGNAYEKYKARLKDGWSPDQLLEAAMNYAEQCRRNRTEKRYTLMGKTFLSDKTPFTDYLSKTEDQATIDSGYGEVDFGAFIQKGGSP